MSEKTCQLIGLIGFVIAGILFVIVGMKAGDTLTILASVIWTLSCLVWMIPLLRSK